MLPHTLVPSIAQQAPESGGFAQERIKEVAPRAIVLSGGPNSVHIADAPQLSPGFFEYCAGAGIPVLGICYGMQLLIHVRYPPSWLKS
jgi:GMP synthase-like glutamine amidotransferase